MNNFWETATLATDNLTKDEIKYCIIKSYGGNPTYEDGNIDIVVDKGLIQTYDSTFSDRFHITNRDKFKNLFYEKNKLMLTPNNSSPTKIHLHKNVGWHNYCFIEANKLMSQTTTTEINNNIIVIPQRAVEARIFVYHVLFEQFKKNTYDNNYITEADYLEFAKSFDIAPSVIKEIIKHKQIIPINELRPIWRAFYHNRKQSISWPRLLHELLIVIYKYRSWKKKH